jgi:hypothetical protein
MHENMKHLAALLLLSVTFGYAGSTLAFNGFVEAGIGRGSSDAKMSVMSDGVINNEGVTTDSGVWMIGLGAQFDNNIKLSLDYASLGSSKFDDLSWMQESEYISLGVSYNLAISDSILFNIKGGYGLWRAKLKQDVPTLNVVVNTQQYSTDDHGFSPTIGFSLSYIVNPNWEIGVRYDKYFRVGEKDTIYDDWYLKIGNFAEYLTPRSTASYDIETLNAFVKYTF